jgi:hypothetical protein
MNPQTSSAQNFKGAFKNLSCPEKRWVIFHPFIAKKTYRLTLQARETSKEMLKDSLLDSDENGGQVDAFRHSYWMALLAKNICWRKALRLGKAHEKGNYLDWKKNKLEEGALPDSASGAMDLFNNKVGVDIGRKSKIISDDELKKIIRSEILSGDMMVIKKNANGKSLDCDGNIIDEQKYFYTWNIPKCLLRSGYHTKSK